MLLIRYVYPTSLHISLEVDCIKTESLKSFSVVSMAGYYVFSLPNAYDNHVH